MNTYATPSPLALLGTRTSARAAAKKGLDGVRGLAAMLLAAAVAALVVVSDQVIDTWADGHLMLAWVFMWAVVFAASLLLAGAARGLAQKVMVGLNTWARRRAEARAEARFLLMAESDPRLMEEYRQARDRANSLSQADFTDALGPLGYEASAPSVSDWAFSTAEKLQMPNGRSYNLYYI